MTQVNNKLKLLFALLASAYFFYYSVTTDEWHFLDTVNLIIHESGHPIFSFFGEFMHILGGSLMQVLVPVVFVLYFFLRREYFSASMLLFWVGQNLINVSVYASDAIVMQLPLLGGDTVGHDWNTLLSMTGTLGYTDSIGKSIFFLGVATIVCATYFSIVYSQRKAT